jgi:hypothetical protein
MILALGAATVAALVLWQLAVVAAVVVLWRLAVRETASRAAAMIAAGALAAGLAVFPLQLARAAKGARDGARFGGYSAEHFGGARRHFPLRSVDSAKAAMPPDALYYFDLRTGPGTTAFRFWARGWLLPRIQVDSLAKADWVVAWQADPRSLPVSYTSLRRIGPTAWVGRVKR